MIDRHYNFNYSSGAGENGYLIKIYNLSIRYYNRGIVLAKEGKYTEAVHSLRKSVALKKDNIQAQNLLGLVYYKLGRVTDGILHWQISLKYQKSGNDALKYIQDCSYNAKEMSKIDAITAYNKALHSIKLDNVDLAVMSLKKALEINSAFVDANILMALCRMKQGNTSAAIRLLEKVLKIDKENEKAVAYLKELKPDTTSVFKKKNKENTEKKGVTIVRNLMNHSYSMLSFGVGALCAVVILGGLIMPAISGGYQKNLEEQELQYNIDLNNKNDQLSKNNETIKRLTDENENLKSKLYTAGEQELQQRVRALADIETYYNEGSVGEAADKLLALSTSGFGQEAVKLLFFRQEQSITMNLVHQASLKMVQIMQRHTLISVLNVPVMAMRYVIVLCISLLKLQKRQGIIIQQLSILQQLPASTLLRLLETKQKNLLNSIVKVNW